MATPPRKLILDNVKTTLEGITVANGYKTTVTTVERVIRWQSVGDQERPHLGFHFPREKYVKHPYSLVEVRMKGIVAAQVGGSSEDEFGTVAANIQDDIIKALYTDPTRGGNAVDTTLGEHEDGQTDEGDPDKIDSRGGAVTVIVPIEIWYERTGAGS